MEISEIEKKLYIKKTMLASVVSNLSVARVRHTLSLDENERSHYDMEIKLLELMKESYE